MLLLYFYIASNKENNYCWVFFFGHSGTNLCNDRYLKQQQQTNKTKQNPFSQPAQGLQFNNIEVHLPDHITYIYMEK